MKQKGFVSFCAFKYQRITLIFDSISILSTPVTGKDGQFDSFVFSSGLLSLIIPLMKYYKDNLTEKHTVQ